MRVGNWETMRMATSGERRGQRVGRAVGKEAFVGNSGPRAAAKDNGKAMAMDRDRGRLLRLVLVIVHPE